MRLSSHFTIFFAHPGKKMVAHAAISGRDSLHCSVYAQKSEFQANFNRVRTKVLTVFCANSLSKSTVFTLKPIGLCRSNAVITSYKRRISPAKSLRLPKQAVFPPNRYLTDGTPFSVEQPLLLLTVILCIPYGRQFADEIEIVRIQYTTFVFMGSRQQKYIFVVSPFFQVDNPRSSERRFPMCTRKIYDLERLYKLSYAKLRQTCGDFQMPKLLRKNACPAGLINFRNAMSDDQFDKYVHFYLNDGEIERIWRNPQRYIGRLKRFSGVLTPDFSLYADMPIAIQIWNVYRSRVLGRIFSQYGCNVIPTVSWSNQRSFSFAFDGIPQKTTVSISSVGIWRDRKFYKHFIEGLSAMIDRILPSNIVFYGKIPQYDFGEIMVKQYTPDTFFWKNKAREVYYRAE